VKARAAAIALAAFGFCGTARALPEHQNMYDAKAGYRASCAACHVPEDQRLTPYGREFLRLGRDNAALRALDVMDPDGDGFSCRSEIRARANPGDARSTPKHVGAWLGVPPTVPAPSGVLESVFGSGVAFDAVRKPLTEAQFRDAEYFLHQRLRDENRVPTVYVLREPEPSRMGLGKAAYAAAGEEEISVFFVVVYPNGALCAVRPIHVLGDQRLAKQEYLDQYEGKTYETLRAVKPPLGAEAQHEETLQAVKRAMRLIELATAGAPQ
jgi:hypothetical protein